jgi:hypothetical protein
LSFADDLLEQAYHLARRDRGHPKQASLRRAVSTAYYPLFHLLIDEAVGNWTIERQRAVLARTFDQGKMRAVCDGYVKAFFRAGQPASGVPLQSVAEAFGLLQRRRHIADYDNSFRADAIGVIDLASRVFNDWTVHSGAGRGSGLPAAVISTEATAALRKSIGLDVR